MWKLVLFARKMLVHLHVNKTNFHMKGFALGLALKLRGNSEIAYSDVSFRSGPRDRAEKRQGVQANIDI